MHKKIKRKIPDGHQAATSAAPPHQFVLRYLRDEFDEADIDNFDLDEDRFLF
jgi:hypothetical protein